MCACNSVHLFTITISAEISLPKKMHWSKIHKFCIKSPTEGDSIRISTKRKRIISTYTWCVLSQICGSGSHNRSCHRKKLSKTSVLQARNINCMGQLWVWPTTLLSGPSLYTLCSEKKHPLLFCCITLRKLKVINLNENFRQNVDSNIIIICIILKYSLLAAM